MQTAWITEVAQAVQSHASPECSQAMNKVVLILMATAATASASAFAGDPEIGRTRSATCTACHGATGTSPNQLWPSLAGQGSAYIVKQLKAFRDGTRKDPLMEPMAKPLSDEDIEHLAAYFSSQSAAPATAGQ